jgi:histidyl-tRNA synthetase
MKKEKRKLMEKVQPRTLPGFMELLPNDQIKFNELKEKIKKSYERFGFLPLDTPIIEDAGVLLAKAGGETEKQIYRFNKGENDLALRFDLTVPLAKYVSEYYGELSFPFKRYQIGKVYRGEKAQAGRYREFYQCDVDIIGDGELSIIHDAEIPSIIYTTFKELGFEKFTIHINNRKILNGIFDEIGNTDKSTEILRIIDKIEKIGEQKVREELYELEIQENEIKIIMNFIKITGNNSEKIQTLKKLGIKSEIFNIGINELEQVINYIKVLGVPEENFEIDLTIARGLDYYTGTVYETFLDDYKKLGSICSGGRYENLAEYYTEKKLPGVGISIGLTRFFYQAQKEGLIKEKNSIAKALVIPMTEKISKCMEVVSKLRNAGINTDIYLENKKIKAKFKYADKLKIPYTIVVGDDEIANNVVTLKNMMTGEQESIKIEAVIEKLI